MISELMIPRHQFLLAFFTIALLSTSLSGYTQSVSVTEPSKSVIEFKMKPMTEPYQTRLVATKQDILRLMLPADEPPYDPDRPPWWYIDIYTPKTPTARHGRWFVVTHDYSKKFAPLPYIDLSIAEVEGSFHPWGHIEGDDGDHSHPVEKIFQESGEYQIILNMPYYRYVEFGNSSDSAALEGYVILK